MRPVIHAILLAATTTLTGRRTFIGVLLICAGPLVEVSYRLFDPNAGNVSDYWNTYHFLFAIRSDLSTIFYATGFYLLLPEFSKVKYFAIVPVAYKLARIIWMVFVSSNAQYHAFLPIHFLLYGGSASLVWFFVFEYLINLHFHKREGIRARVFGIMNTPGIDNDTKVAIAQREITNYNAL